MKSEIIDVRLRDDHDLSNDESRSEDLRAQIVQGLSRPHGEKTLPTMLLYDERGLRLYDAITTDAPEYYLFGSVLSSRT